MEKKRKMRAGFDLTRQGCRLSRMRMIFSRRLLISVLWPSVLLILVIQVQPIHAQHCPSEQGALASPNPVVD
ncbi:MAG: hypothetical protein PVF79_21755, partial [Desulfobacterales bacterium]